jgi:hypothetical protein
MRRRAFLALASVAAAVPLRAGPADVARPRVAKQLRGVEELRVLFKDGAAIDIKFWASDNDPAGWDVHDAHIPLHKPSGRVHVVIDPRVLVEEVVDSVPGVGPGVTWLEFPQAVRVIVTDGDALTVMVEPEQEL